MSRYESDEDAAGESAADEQEYRRRRLCPQRRSWPTEAQASDGLTAIAVAYRCPRCRRWHVESTRTRP